MLSPFHEFFMAATRMRPRQYRSLPNQPRADKGRWRASPHWRDMPEDFCHPTFPVASTPWGGPT